MKHSIRSLRLSRTTAAERARWGHRFSHSGLSPADFADQQGLRLSSLQRWLRQAAAPAMPPTSVVVPSFAELKLPALAPAPRWVAELLQPDGRTLRLAHDVPAGLVRQLLRAC